MTAAQSRTEIVDLLARHGVEPRKHLGQHFLADRNIVDKIVRLAGVSRGGRVVEIGAGTGTLTRALWEAGARVVTFEIDERLRPVLDESLRDADVDVRFADAARVGLPEQLGEGRWTLVANLPYNVGTPLVLDLLRDATAIERFVVMLQREVADRLCAAPGSAAYGLPSVRAALRATARQAFVVPPQVFVPAPEVESAVIVLERVDPPAHAHRAEAIAATAFGQRRKMLRRSLAGTTVDIDATLRAAGVDPAARPEQLGVAEWIVLAAALPGGRE
ncbi:MAG: 16S rRNA (adenine(1518)-N(6)/adenine(1519)-N(6))-dimethyltransferase RsmA [Acidimicrobiia bacterium]